MDEKEKATFDRELVAEPPKIIPRTPDTRMPSQGGEGGGGVAAMMALMGMPQAGG
jgi:hypothetical protein